MSTEAMREFDTMHTKSKNQFAGRKHYSTFNLTIFIFKVILATFTVYLGIAFGYAAFLPLDYGRDRANFAHTLSTSALQPYMDVFSSGKISHFYDWREFPSRDMADETYTLKVRSSNQQVQNYDETWTQLRYDLKPAREAVILEPSTYEGTWSLVKCTASKPDSNEKICQRSNLTHKGKIRYSIDGESEVWGVDTNGKMIQLKAVEYIDRSQKRTLLLL